MKTIIWMKMVSVRCEGKKPLLVFALAYLLSACATLPETVNGRLVPPEGQAYVILATTYQISQGASINGESGAEIVATDQKFTVITNTGNRRIQSPEGQIEVKGGLHLITLAPGEYRIVRVFGSYQEDSFDFGIGFAANNGNKGMGVGVGASTGGGRRSFAVPAKYIFQMAAGEVVYVGDAEIKLDRIPSATLKNETVRDFYHMRKVWKVTDFSNIQTRLATEKQ